MASPPSALHVYDREIQTHERTSLSVLVAHIPVGASVLDLGCGSGAVGRHLAERDGAAAGPIDGLTISADEAALAAPHYRHVEVADLDAADLTALFPAASYDIIVCADVLEHIRGSDRVLAQCRELLAPGGRALLSIPNAGYSGLVAELMSGEFRYRKEGLLDETHVRFFTRSTLIRFLADNGWVADSMEVVERELPASEFNVAFDALPPSVARYLLALPDALTYQFVVVGRPAAPGEQMAHFEPPVQPAAALFTSQLYLGADRQYREATKLVATGVMGKEYQTVRFDLPAGVTAESLRWDPADRPGFMHVHAMQLRSTEGNTIWQWTPDQAHVLDECDHDNIAIRPRWALSEAALLLLANDDPWIVLPIPADVLIRAMGGTLDLTVGWPMSADYLALSDAVNAEIQRSNERQTTLVNRIQQLEERLAATAQALETLERSSDQDRERLAAQNTQLSVQTSQIRELTSRNNTLGAQRDEAMQLVQSIQESTVFRATRPIVHSKMWLDRQLGRGRVRTAGQRVDSPLQPRETPVDLIVPVYRGLGDTQRCIRSVLATDCTTPWRLVVINDASPEPEVTAWLREIASQDSRIELLENESNLGFVGTVNRGMALTTDRDVLLLNSDAEVANNWLDRIRAAAYRGQRIASVTPFSNNATICSYPRFCEDNELPAGWSLAELDALCAEVLSGQAVDVPTGVGFCMYIRRDALDDVGLFDVENFGKGYGEENDFCQRALAQGWRNLHALDTFVFHAGGISFGASKSPRERAAMEIMRQLHPTYERDVMEFVMSDPAAPARAMLDFARVSSRAQPVVLTIIHNREGGTARHVRDLAQILAPGAAFLTLVPAPDSAVLLRVADARPGQSDLRFQLPDEFDDLITTLRHLGVQHLHIHHTLGHSELITDVLPRRLGVRHDFTIHDFLTVCPQISMVGTEGVYCGEEGVSQCERCVRKQPAPGGASIQGWRLDHADLLLRARYVIAPSADAQARMMHYQPHANYVLVPHPEQAGGQPAQMTTATRAPLNAAQPLKVAVIGAMSAIKGADVLEDVAKAARRDRAPVEFHLLGYGYRTLTAQPRASLTVYGPYDEADLPQLLDWLQPDLVWFPAQVPETYSYTLSAALAANLPIVASDLGAFAERLASHRWSWIRPWDTPPQDWLDFFVQVRQDHFIPGQPPSGAHAPAKSLPSQAPDTWYRSTYLLDLPHSPASGPLSVDVLARHLVRRAGTDGTIAGVARRSTLSTLVRLRSHPLLAPVARAIPPRLQARIKNWLTR